MTTEVSALAVSLKEKLMAAAKRKEKVVTVGDCQFRIRELSAKETAPFFENLQKDGEERLEAMAGMIALSVIDDETGERVFSKEDIPAILDWSSSMLTDIGMEVIELNGRTKKAQDEEIKNSKAQTSDLLAG